jgi:hypothetical protein
MDPAKHAQRDRILEEALSLDHAGQAALFGHSLRGRS